MQLNLSDTPVANLEPLKALTGLQRLVLYSAQVADSEIDRLLQYRKQNGLPWIHVIWSTRRQ